MPDPQDKKSPALEQPSISPQLPKSDKPEIGAPQTSQDSAPQPSGPQSPPPPPPVADQTAKKEESSDKEPPPLPDELGSETQSQAPQTQRSASPSPPSPPPPPPTLTPQASPAGKPPPPPTEIPKVKPPDRGGKIKKILLFAAIALAFAAIGFFVVKILIPRLRSVDVPGLPGKQVTLRYWGLWEEESIIKGLIDEYETEHPNITIQYSQQVHDNYRKRLQRAIQEGDGPDIFRFHNTWAPMLRNELSRVPADVYSSSDFQETFYPVAAQDLRLGANFVGVPLEIDGIALFYNKDIFNEGGIEPPSSWEELRKAAFDLTIRDSSGRIQRGGAALGTTSNVDHWSDILGLMMLQNGADLSDPTDKFAADALLFYTIFTRSDNVWNESLPQSTQAFATAKVAMYFAPSWRVLHIKALNPDLNFEVIPAPQLPKSNVSWATYWAEGVSSASENQAEAWEFIKFLSSKSSLEKFYSSAVASGRQIGEPYSRKDMADLLRDDPYAGAFVEQAPYVQSWYLASDTHDDGINDRMIEYFEDAVNAVNDKSAPQDALATAAEGIKRVLSQYGIK